MATETHIKHAFCQMCGPARVGCSTRCYITDGEWKQVAGNPLANNNGRVRSESLCAKGNAAMQALYSPSRITHPLRRTGEKGAGHFEQVSWGEAMDEIASVLRSQKEAYGPESYGVLSPQFLPVLATLGRRFLNVHGSPNFLHSGICHAQRAFSRLVTIGGASLAQANDTAPGQLDKTKLLVAWGCNTENSGVNLGDPTKRLDAIARGMKVIDIRPMRDALAAKADIWVPVRPGTDAALAMAILQVIIGEGLYDEDFVAQWCDGFDELALSVRKHTPAWAARITGVPASDIVRIARLMATEKPLGIQIGNGVGDQQNDGHWAVACICLISAITGNLAIPGGGGAAKVMPPPLVTLKPLDRLSDRLSASAEDREKGYMPGVSNLVAPETPRWFQTAHTQETGPTGAYYRSLMSILTKEPYPLRFLLAQGTNPLSATRQPKRVVEALKKLDYFVVMDTHWNPSCDYADFVLPACMQYEVSHQIATRNRLDGTWVGMSQQIVAASGEARSDWDFYLDLAVRMGYGDDFWQGDMEACLRYQLEGTGLTLEQLRAAEQGILIKRDRPATMKEPAYRTYKELFAALPNNKVQCYNAWIGGKPDARGTGTLSPLPMYRGPAEGLAETPSLAKEYPLIFSDVHADRLCQHGYYVDIPLLREHEPYPWVRINPKTARSYGINDGDWIKVESPHGHVVFVARYFDAIAPDVLMARRGWWQECRALGLEGYAPLDGGSEVNVLYDADPNRFDGFHSAMSKQTLVRIGKLGKPPVETATLLDGSPVQRIIPAQESIFTVDTDRCIGCLSCVVACKQWNGVAAGGPARRVVQKTACGEFPRVERSFTSLACHHCENPACLASCAFDAIIKSEEDAVVFVDKDACTGCGACVVACPYGVPQLMGNVMDKCDCCMTSGVEPGVTPHCVRTCPTGALRYHG